MSNSDKKIMPEITPGIIINQPTITKSFRYTSYCITDHVFTGIHAGRTTEAPRNSFRDNCFFFHASASDNDRNEKSQNFQL